MKIISSLHKEENMSRKSTDVDYGVVSDVWKVRDYIGKRKHGMPFYKHKIQQRVAYQFNPNTWVATTRIQTVTKIFLLDGSIEPSN